MSSAFIVWAQARAIASNFFGSYFAFFNAAACCFRASAKSHRASEAVTRSSPDAEAAMASRRRVSA